jgi:hypothetical protein
VVPEVKNEIINNITLAKIKALYIFIYQSSII